VSTLGGDVLGDYSVSPLCHRRIRCDSGHARNGIMNPCLRDRPTCVRDQRQSTFRYTAPQAAAVGATEAPVTATVPVSEVAKTATYTRGYATSTGS
jgi:hypothetical protein